MLSKCKLSSSKRGGHESSSLCTHPAGQDESSSSRPHAAGQDESSSWCIQPAGHDKFSSSCTHPAGHDESASSCTHAAEHNESSSLCTHPAGHDWFMSITGCRSCLRCHKMSASGHWTKLKKPCLVDKSKAPSKNIVKQQEPTNEDLADQQRSICGNLLGQQEPIKDLVDQHMLRSSFSHLHEEKPLSECERSGTVKHPCSNPTGHDWFLSITGCRSCLHCHKMSYLGHHRTSSTKRHIQSTNDISVYPQKSTFGDIVNKKSMPSTLMDGQKSALGNLLDSPQPANIPKLNKKRRLKDDENISRSQSSSNWSQPSSNWSHPSSKFKDRRFQVSSKCGGRREGLQSSSPDGHIWFVSIMGIKSCLRCNRIMS